jgi:hypothetical protein
MAGSMSVAIPAGSQEERHLREHLPDALDHPQRLPRAAAPTYIGDRARPPGKGPGPAPGVFRAVGLPVGASPSHDVIRVTWRQLTTAPEEVLVLVARALFDPRSPETQPR